ncbi:MAG: 4-hydroxy-3-polyprenylbenzoate decarboxylase, partial [Campylobacterota bacterium]|nr:4-hydroxy-3-polyprenylbenzoate decarboxylase [Campylobacterota bacterium]
MTDVVAWLKENGNLKIIEEPLDVELEIPHVAYIEVKKEDSRPLLFV